MTGRRSRGKTRRNGRSMKARMINDAQKTIGEIQNTQQKHVDAAKERRRKKRTQKQKPKQKPTPIQSDEEGQPDVFISEGIPPVKNKVTSTPLGLQIDPTTGLLLPVQILPPLHSRNRVGRPLPTPKTGKTGKTGKKRRRSRSRFLLSY